jgi:orotidine-5'-phosphate decarboxylase
MLLCLFREGHADMARVIIPLDVPSLDDAMDLVDSLGDAVDFYKVGLELFTREGSSAVRALKERDKRVFLDLKLHDIPNTVARAVARASELEVDLLTLHTTGGRRMMEAAAEAAGDRLTLLGVTVLTSMTPSDVAASWGRPVDSIEREAMRLARLAQESGIGGVVASVWEAAPIKEALGSDLVVVTPGIRLAGDGAHDQARVASPAEAVAAGADYLVIGRSVTQAPDPAEALRRVYEEMAGPSAVGMA